jgi:hypothetical protein
MKADDAFDMENLRLVERSWTPRKIAKRREHFVQVPFEWLGRLNGAGGQVYALALHLLYLHWKGKGAPIKLATGMLKIDGIGRSSKWRALVELERRGLISIRRRPKKSPLITINYTPDMHRIWCMLLFQIWCMIFQNMHQIRCIRYQSLICLSCYSLIIVRIMTETLLEQLRAYEDEHAFLRQFVVPEEDRHRFTTVKWAGEYRWFRSPNVVALEKVRSIKQAQAKHATAA